MDITKEQQFIRLNKDIDILMTAGDYTKAIDKIDLALPLCKEIANRTSDYKKINLMKSNFEKLKRKKEICEEHLGVVSSNVMVKPKEQVKKVTPKAKPAQVKSEPCNLDDALKELNELVGLYAVKEKINSIVQQIQNFNQRKQMGLKVPKVSYHMVFTGNPGTGKTTVARIISKIFTSLGVVSGNDEPYGLVETQRNNLVAGYVGQTAKQTQEVIDKSIGGVLFIDEAYTLSPKGGGNDFGQEAIDTLLVGMENNRDNLVVIAAGYDDEMVRFINSNPGLESRFKTFIHFDDYNGEDLYKIFSFQLKKNEYVLEDAAKDKLKDYFNLLYKNRDENFANARNVRNTFEAIIEQQAKRLVLVNNPSREDLETITLDDLKCLDKK